MKILLTGASGFIGNSILKNLIDIHVEKIDVIYACSNSTDIVVKYPKIKSLKFNILSDVETKKVLEELEIDVVIHAAWFVKHPEYKSSLANFDYIKATCELARICKNKKLKKFIFLGSSFEENAIFADVYSKAKELTTFLLNEFYKNKITQLQIVRPSFVFGIGEPSTKFVSNTILRMLKGEDIFCKVPNNYLNFIDVKDVGGIISKTVFSQQHMDINAGDMELVSIKDVILHCAEKIGFDKSKIYFNENKKYEMDFVSNVDKIGYKFDGTIFENIDKMINFYKNE